MAGWLLRTLGPYADHFQVADPRRNALIARSEKKSDRSDAEQLAWLYRGGLTHAVHHTTDERHFELKETLFHYHDCVNQVVRFKNKLKALYRRHGMIRLPDGIYDPHKGLDYLKRLPFPSSRHRARMLLSQVAGMEQASAKAHRRLRQLSARFPAIEMFERIPGVGLIVAATVVAIVETPHRFPTKRHLWKYAALAVANPESGGKSYGRYASKEGNRLLKKVLMMAALNASKGESRFSRQYRALKPRGSSIAQRTVARSILAVMYGMWKTGELYRET
jgi:transposase